MTKLETLLKEFKCNRNSGITKFLEYSAIKGQENGTSNTYLILDDKRNNLRAFFTLVQKDIDTSAYNLKDDPIEIEVNPATKFIKESDNLILDKNMIIGKKSKERLSGSKKFTKVSSIHIAQFAKSDNHTIQGTILWQAFYGIMSK